MTRDPRAWRVLAGPVQIIEDDDAVEQIRRGGIPVLTAEQVGVYQTGDVIPPHRIGVDAARVYEARGIIELADPPEIQITDPAAELAEKHGIDPATIRGSGADGSVLVKDVRAAIEALETEADEQSEGDEEGDEDEPSE